MRICLMTFLKQWSMNRNYKLIVRSKNHSCAPLRGIRVARPTILRLGSTTPTNEITHRRNCLELNKPEACKVSGNKILMKEVLIDANVHTAEYFTLSTRFKPSFVKDYFNRFETIIAKHKHSSKGNGIFLLKTYDDFKNFLQDNNPVNFVFEKYYKFNKEYRLHVTNDGCFYTCRKMLKRDAEDRWHRHDSNSVWILEENPAFDKPENWGDIVNDCITALNALGLDIAAFDVKCESGTANPDWIILESNSAPALGDVGIQKYKDEIYRLSCL